jgi:hypothetical protein
MVASKPSPSGLHYQDPPHLWPILAGVSVLVHLGALILAWPLVLNVARSMAVPTSVTVPVELVTPEQIAARANNPQGETAEVNPKTASPRPNSSAPDPTPPSNSAENPDSTEMSPNQTFPSGSGAPRDVTSGNSGQGDFNGDKRDQSDSDQTASEPDNSGSGQTDSGEGTGQGNADQGDSGQGDSDPTDNGQGDTGGNLTPPPNNTTDPEGSFFVGVEGVSPVPADIPGDRPDEYPELQPGTNNSIVLNPRDIEGCGATPASLSGTTSLRVAIEADGRVSAATPWPDRSAATEFDRFIACVLPEADFRFTPARTGTRAVPTDMIILDVTLSPG